MATELIYSSQQVGVGSTTKDIGAVTQKPNVLPKNRHGTGDNTTSDCFDKRVTQQTLYISTDSADQILLLVPQYWKENQNAVRETDHR